MCSWRYENPYNIYDLYLNDYLGDRYSWGIEQFVLEENDNIIAYVSCQIIKEDMWVGWSLRPDLCGNRIGKDFVKKCINELIILKKHYKKDIFLKVISWNTRAIKAYEKSGFIYYDKLIRFENSKPAEYCIMKMNIK
ncbi:GNAT family N-acetyltransferase [Clostridium sp.]|uniref:GNAT family N-acetyltransferase n=1 Tax=Clostridium sp. TaxID=1506 RepID=UPI0032175BD0